MKHAASRELFAYWQKKRGTRPAPERAEIEPGAIRSALSDAFILALDRDAGYPVRLAGTRVCALFARTIGILAPLHVPSWLGATPIGSLTLGGRRHIGAELDKRLVPRFFAPRGRRGLLVYDGGRATEPRIQDEDGPTAA